MSIRFLSPTEGACLPDRAGDVQNGRLFCRISLRANVTALWVCGVPAARSGDIFTVTLPLSHGKNTLTARGDNGESATVSVWYLPKATGRFRLSFDDNIRFLADIARQGDTYRSVFENDYLAMLRRLHSEYGAVMHLNLFYASADGLFTLADMPDTYKREFTENADWLHFSFHAHAEYPDRPYLGDDGTAIRRDLDAVRREILRFAGEDCYAPAETTLHWGACTKEGACALRACGVRHIAGYFNPDKNGNAGPVSYHLTADKLPALAENGIWYDGETDLFCTKIDAVLNEGTVESIRKALDEAFKKAPTRGFFEALMHEQYFYPDYRRHLPDFETRLRVALDWAREKHLTPTFLSELTV